MNNPLSSVDPNGLSDEPCGGGGNVVALSGEGDGPDPCGGGVDPAPKPMPPDIDPCAGASKDCYSKAAANEVKNDAAMLTFVSMKDPACRSALAAAGQSSSALTRAFSNWPTLQAAGSGNGIDPSFLAGTGVRESGFQNIRQYGGGMGRGYFQIDLGAHPGVSESQAFDINFSANFAGHLLSSNRRSIAQHHPNLDAAQQMQAAAASYNGSKISGNPNTIDVGTTGGNYGGNVMSLTNSCFAF